MINGNGAIQFVYYELVRYVLWKQSFSKQLQTDTLVPFCRCTFINCANGVLTFFVSFALIEPSLL